MSGNLQKTCKPEAARRQQFPRPSTQEQVQDQREQDMQRQHTTEQQLPLAAVNQAPLPVPVGPPAQVMQEQQQPQEQTKFRSGWPQQNWWMPACYADSFLGTAFVDIIKGLVKCCTNWCTVEAQYQYAIALLMQVKQGNEGS